MVSFVRLKGQVDLKEKRIKIAYARVSSNKQKSELQNQILHLENYASGRGIIIDKYIRYKL